MKIITSCNIYAGATVCMEQTNTRETDSRSDGREISPFRPCLLVSQKPTIDACSEPDESSRNPCMLLVKGKHSVA